LNNHHAMKDMYNYALFKANNAGFRSALAPGWGQFYKRQNSKGLALSLKYTF
jgi:hypothetical protein